ncbi:MAG: DUF4062 domain-containing protein [Pantoea sp.]|uniref:DUF4062 domain-containing protein n=1 Tax=Pantoea sp. TaxID=69393 RepID=UPI0039E22E8A
MDKRYQVFVSSTFADLEDERRHVIQTLMEMDCIPAGMELFPAIDEEQWEFIKKVIDDCDYYLLIIGGRYGSLANDGLSYTEKEFDYAVEKGLKITVLLHDDPDSLPAKKTEIIPESREKLLRFIDKAQTGRLRKTWKSPQDLPGLVALSMTKTIRTYPAVGWVRADKVSNESSLIEINELRKQNNELIIQNNKLTQEIQFKISNSKALNDLASFDSEFEFTFYGYVSTSNRTANSKYNWDVSLTWKEIFFYISPKLTKYVNEESVSAAIAECASEKAGKSGRSMRVNEQDFFTMGIQFQAYGLVSIENLKTTKGTMANFWILTEEGKDLMLQLRIVK